MRYLAVPAMAASIQAFGQSAEEKAVLAVKGKTVLSVSRDEFGHSRC